MVFPAVSFCGRSKEELNTLGEQLEYLRGKDGNNLCAMKNEQTSKGNKHIVQSILSV